MKLEDDNVNTHISMYGSADHIFQYCSRKYKKSRLKRFEKRVSKQADAALGALPKELDHNGENMSEEQRKDPLLKLHWQRVSEYQKEEGLL